MKTANINVTRIDKSALYEGKNGKYLSLVFFDNKDGQDQFGNDGFITQDIGKERRMAGEKGPIIGNWKEVGTKSPMTATPQQSQAAAQVEDNSDIPF